MSTSVSPISPWSKSTEPALDVYLLGMVDFDACLYLQECLAAELAGRNDNSGILLLCEHPPLITIGREGSRAHLRCEPEELAARQLEVRWLNRGGGCVAHLPGQLAAYPIVPLQSRKLGLIDFRERLEEAAVAVCHEFHVSAWRRAESAGVWCRGGQVAHLGVAIRSWVSYHGLFLNVSPRLDVTRLVQSNVEGRVTSLAAQRLRLTPMPAVRESLIRHLAERLEYQRYHLYTGHPLLRRTRRIVAYA